MFGDRVEGTDDLPLLPLPQTVSGDGVCRVTSAVSPAPSGRKTAAQLRLSGNIALLCSVDRSPACRQLVDSVEITAELLMESRGGQCGY